MDLIKRIGKSILINYYRNLTLDIGIFKRANSILDVGCGRYSALRHIAIRPKIAYGIEGNKEAYLQAKKSKYYQKVYFGMIQNILPKLAKEKQKFDIVLLSDIVEHLHKKEAIKIIKMCEKLGKKIIIFTPKGYLDQDAYDGNSLQIHKSGWDIKEFKKMNYKVKVIKNFSIKSIYATKQNK